MFFYYVLSSLFLNRLLPSFMGIGLMNFYVPLIRVGGIIVSDRLISYMINTKTSDSGIIFNEWLVGFIEGNGNFYLTGRIRPNGKVDYTFCLMVVKSSYYLGILQYIQRVLGVGRIKNNTDTSERSYTRCEYTISSKVELKNSVIPVFSSYRFFTSKEQAFNLFKQALNVDSRSVLGEIRQLMLDHKVNHSYIPSTYETLPSKSWLVGFVEAEGNFFITKEGGKYVHGFSLNVNRDTFILEKIRMMLKIPEEVYPNYNKRTGAYSFSTLKTLNEGALKYIADYFNNCFISSFSQESDTLHGGVEFPLWRESLINNRDNQEALKETLNHMRNLRNADVIRSTPQNLAHQLREESLLRLEKDKSLSIVEDKKLRSVIIGILLGNACTERRGNTRLKIVQGIKNQEYLMHLWHLFHEKGLCSSEKPKAIAKPRSKSDPRMYTVLRFYTYARPEFNIYDELFYPKSSSSPNKKVKRVPSNIANFLDFRALAYWLMDCGANTPASLRGKICTHRYPLEDIELLRGVLIENFGLYTSITRDGYNNEGDIIYALSIYSSNYDALSRTICPFMIRSRYLSIFRHSPYKRKPEPDDPAQL